MTSSIQISPTTSYSASLGISLLQYHLAKYTHRCYTESILYSNTFITLFILFLFGNTSTFHTFNGNSTSFIQSFYLYTIAFMVGLSFCIIVFTTILRNLLQLFLLFTGIISTNTVEFITLYQTDANNGLAIAESILSGIKSFLWIPLIYISINLISAVGYPIIGTHYVYNPFSFMAPFMKLLGNIIPVFYGTTSTMDHITDVYTLQDIDIAPSTTMSKILQVIVIYLFGSRLLSPGGIVSLILLGLVGIYSATPKAILSGLTHKDGTTVIYPEIKLSGLESKLLDWSQGMAIDDGLVSGIIRRLLCQFVGLDTWILNAHFQNEYLALSTKIWGYLKWLILTCCVLYIGSNLEIFGKHVAYTAISLVFMLACIGGLYASGFTPMGQSKESVMGLSGKINDLISKAWTHLGWEAEYGDVMAFPSDGLTKFTDFVQGYTGGNFLQQVDGRQIHCQYGDIRVVPADMEEYLRRLREVRQIGREDEAKMRYCKKLKYRLGKQCPYQVPTVSEDHRSSNSIANYIEKLMPEKSVVGQRGGGDGLGSRVPVQFELRMRESGRMYPLEGLRGYLSTNELEMGGRRYEWTDVELRRLVEGRMREIEARYGSRYLPKRFMERGDQVGKTGIMYVDGVPLVITKDGKKKLVGLNGDVMLDIE